MSDVVRVEATPFIDTPRGSDTNDVPSMAASGSEPGPQTGHGDLSGEPSTLAGGKSDSHDALVEVYRDADALVARYLTSDAVGASQKAHVEQSLQIIDRALDEYGPGELAMSFNGGKDCHVMLILILAQVYRHYDPSTLRKLPAIHIRVHDSFPMVDAFVEECATRYHLHLDTDTRSMKDALAEYLVTYPQIKAIFVGIRRQDPYADKLQHVQRTDHEWPDFMRIHPVLEWDYGDIWDFLCTLKIPYCPLYDEGYTSLGGITTTVRNPALRISDFEYLPAYELKDYADERVGRFQKN